MPIVECALPNCKNTVYAKPSQLAKMNCYCSKECSVIGRDKRTKLNCLHCGKEFLSRRCELAKGIGSCCSVKCGHRYRAAHNNKDYEIIFWSKVDIKGSNECWPYKEGKNEDGYGTFKAKDGHVRAHRYSYELTYGPIDSGKVILHECDNPPCCNPLHLKQGTQAQNIYDMVEKKRHRCPEGSNHAHSKLTNEIVLAIRSEYTGKKGEQTWIGNKYGITSANVKAIVERRTWKHV